MKGRHIAFFLDQAYGNTIPSLGIATALMKRGHHVSYIVTDGFAPLIRSIGATPVVVDFLKIRGKILSELAIEDDHVNLRMTEEQRRQRGRELMEERTHHALTQLERLRDEWKPDLVIHDDSLDRTGRELALQRGLPKVRFATQFIEPRHFDSYPRDETILVTVPEFFQERLDQLKSDSRFKLLGFIPEGRCLPFRPWTALQGDNPRVLVSPTSGLLRQSNFCKKVLEILRDQPWDIILSISASQDELSAFDPEALGEMPGNVHINTRSGNFEIMQNVQLFIGQAGQGGALEAIYWGVPQILLPPTPYHYLVARRVSDLGLGVCLPVLEMSPESLLGHASTLLNDEVTRARVNAAASSMRGHSGAELAANILEERLGS